MAQVAPKKTMATYVMVAFAVSGLLLAFTEIGMNIYNEVEGLVSKVLFSLCLLWNEKF